MADDAIRSQKQSIGDYILDIDQFIVGEYKFICNTLFYLYSLNEIPFSENNCRNISQKINEKKNVDAIRTVRT